MAHARIYRPAKTAMQSGVARSPLWVLEFDPQESPYIEPVMGWVGTRDSRSQIRLTFPTRLAAETYARKNKILYHLEEPQEPQIHPKR